MIVTHEELAAYADGELEGAEAARVVLAVAASPELMRMVQRHRALRERIGAEFAPILRQEVPERLAALLRSPEGDSGSGPKREPEVEARALRPGPRQIGHQPIPQPGGTAPAQERQVPAYRRWLLLPLLAGALAVSAFLPGGPAREMGEARDQRLAASASDEAQEPGIVPALEPRAGPSLRGGDGPAGE